MYDCLLLYTRFLCANNILYDKNMSTNSERFVPFLLVTTMIRGGLNFATQIENYVWSNSTRFVVLLYTVLGKVLLESATKTGKKGNILVAIFCYYICHKVINCLRSQEHVIHQDPKWLETVMAKYKHVGNPYYLDEYCKSVVAAAVEQGESLSAQNKHLKD